MDYLKINRQLWDNKTNTHFNSDFYDVSSFLKGKDSLNSIEIELLGDIEGKSILHLQCHFGMDSISLSRRGAQVTGIDFSGEAIQKAHELKAQMDTDTRFIQSDVYGLKEKLDEKFDLVFTSYGVVGWLPDMQKWADIIQHFLKPSGTFLMVEFHPMVWMFDQDYQKVEFPYLDREPFVEEVEGTYTDRDAPLKDKSVSWNHGLARVIQALIEKKLLIEDFQEYFYSPYDCFNKTLEIEPGKFQIQGLENKLPMLYSVLARK